MHKSIVIAAAMAAALISGLAWAAPPVAAGQTVYISGTKLDSLISSLNTLSAALTNANVAVSGVGAASGGATQIGAGARTSTGGEVTEGTARSESGVSNKYGTFGVAVTQDLGADEGMAINSAGNTSLLNALQARILQQSVAETEQRLRQQEDQHAQQMRFAEDNHAVTLRSLSEGQAHTTDRYSQDVRHADIAVYGQWYGKPPTGEQDSSVAPAVAGSGN